MTRLFVVRHGNTFEAGEAPRRIGSRTDLPLTNTGLEQAKALGRHFGSSGIAFGRVVSSPLRRTRTTAEAILTETPEFVASPHPQSLPTRGREALEPQGGGHEGISHLPPPCGEGSRVGVATNAELATPPPSPLWGGIEGGGLSATHSTIPIESSGFLAEIDHGPDENQPEPAVLARIGEAALAAWEASATPPPGWIVDADSRLAAWQTLAAVESATNRDVLLVTSNGAARFALLAYGLAPQRLRTGAYGIIALAPDAPPTLLAWDVRP